MPSKNPNARQPGRPPVYPFGSMRKGEMKVFDTKDHPGAVQSAYQMGHRTGTKFSVHRVPGSTKVEISRIS
jgi:hypothetical protein